VRPAEPARNAQHTYALNVLDTDSGFSPLMELITQSAFPELEFDDDAVCALGEAVHVCLCLFCSSERSVLSKHGALPIAKWQSSPLLLEDHKWLHERAQNFPNPKVFVPDEVAMRYGKDSPNQTRGNFWKALVTISEQLGGFVPETLGSLHGVPLLTTSGALIIVLYQDFASLPTTSTKSRSVKWRPMGQVAAKLSRVAQAAELETYCKDGSSHTYGVRSMLTTVPTRELSPVNWLEQLCHASTAVAMPLKPGTHVVALYTRSTRNGLEILVPRDKSHGFMPPHVRISEESLSVEEWAQLCEIERASKAGVPASQVPNNWAAANDWLGPELGSEKQFTALQKFFFGVVNLRQRLERDCGATREDLRHSRATGAVASLASLGSLYDCEIILADPQGRSQLLVVCDHLHVANVEQFPKEFRWTPFPLFEAQFFANSLPVAHEAYCVCRDLALQGGAEEMRLRQGSILRNSMRDSGTALRTSALSDKSSASLHCSMQTASSVPVFDHMEDERVLSHLWEPLRWTKRVVLESCRSSYDAMINVQVMTESTIDQSPMQPKQRAERHVRVYQEALAALKARAQQTRKKIEQLVAVAPLESNAGDEEKKTSIEENKSASPAARKLSYTL